MRAHHFLGGFYCLIFLRGVGKRILFLLFDLPLKCCLVFSIDRRTRKGHGFTGKITAIISHSSCKMLGFCWYAWTDDLLQLEHPSESLGLVKHVKHVNHLTSGVWPSPFRIRTNIPPNAKRNIIDSNMPWKGGYVGLLEGNKFWKYKCCEESVWVWAKFTPGIGGNLKPSFFVIILQMYFLQVLYHQFTHQSLTC